MWGYKQAFTVPSYVRVKGYHRTILDCDPGSGTLLDLFLLFFHPVYFRPVSRFSES